MRLLRTLADSAALHGAAGRLERTASRRRPAGAGRHLALLAWALPPNTNPGVHRPLSFLRYGPGLGWRIDAFHGVAPANQREHGDELRALVPAAVRLHEVPDSTLRPSYRFTPQVDGGFANALAFAQAAIAALRDDPPDVVLASGPPFFVFVAARWVARHFGARLVLDYRDEWSECPFDFVAHHRDDRGWEARCLADADAVLFTTESHRRHQLQAFTALRAERCHRLPNGWEASDFVFDDQPARAPAGRGPWVLAHVGTLAGHTPIAPLLASLDALLQAEPARRASLRLQLVGRRTPQADSALATFAHPGVVDAIGHVAKREAALRMRDADALLLIAQPELERYLPGKLFDYVAARRPVLVFGARGEASELLSALGVGRLCPPDDPAALAQALDALAALDLHAAAPGVQAWLAQHRRDVLAGACFERLAQVVASA